MVSVILSSFNRPHLLRLGLYSILKYKPNFPFEIIVVNDGLEDGTKEVCTDFIFDGLDIKYIFSGQRHLDGIIKPRVSGFALNIGVKQSIGDIIILSCPEIYHLNNCLEILVSNLKKSPKSMIIPEFLYFDAVGEETKKLINMGPTQLNNYQINYKALWNDPTTKAEDFYSCHVVMPFLMAFYKKEFIDIGGYDEDFIGYAGEDNNLIDRFRLKGLDHLRTEARAIHLYHGNSNSITTDAGHCHWGNKAWEYNWNLLQARKGILVANIGREWGINK